MRSRSFVTFPLLPVLSVCLLVCRSSACADGLRRDASVPPSEVVEDEVYLQEIGQQVVTGRPLRSVAVVANRVFVADRATVYRLEEGDGEEGGQVSAPRLRQIPGAPSGVVELHGVDGSLWARTGAAVLRLEGGAWEPVFAGATRDLCADATGVFVLANDAVREYVDGEWLVRVASPGARGVEQLARYAGTLHGFSRRGATALVADAQGPRNAIDFGNWRGAEPRDARSLGNRVALATDRGVALLEGAALRFVDGGSGLPFEDVRCVARGLAGELWLGTSHGAIRWTASGEFHVFGASRWVPAPGIHSIACSGRRVFLAGDGGLGIIVHEPFTLRRKADYYERHLEARGQKRLGFVHKLVWSDEASGWWREVSDNDGGWSCHYLAAMSFKYAVTGEESAREEARETFRSLVWLEAMTPIDGFVARSVWAKGETGFKARGGSGGYPAEWHDTADGQFEWKGDTSSDEIDAHFYAVPIFHDLVADEPEKRQAAEFLASMTRHIVREGWVLRDLDGKPTVWGRWDPEYFESAAGSYARGLNGMEALTFVATARALAPRPMFDRAHAQLVEWGYPRHVVRQKLVFPPEDLNHSDDRLAFMAYSSLLAYEPDRGLQSLYRRSLERSWHIERPESNPWFNFIYGARTGQRCDAAAAVEHLRAWPLDLRAHSWDFTDREDLHTFSVSDVTGARRAFSPREIGPLRWSHDPTRTRGGNGGRVVVDPSGWLDAYWMGRYYGFVTAPRTDDPGLRQARDPRGWPGAAPYDGPPRPPLSVYRQR